MDVSTLNETALFIVISTATGIPQEDLLISFDSDDDGKIIRVYVTLRDDETADFVVILIKTSYESPQCSLDILCHAKRVFKNGEISSNPLSLSLELGQMNSGLSSMSLSLHMAVVLFLLY